MADLVIKTIRDIPAFISKEDRAVFVKTIKSGGTVRLSTGLTETQADKKVARLRAEHGLEGLLFPPK